MKKEDNTIKVVPAESGKFGPVYRQFAGKPKEAIKFLREKKDGECLAALHRTDIGDIDIVWGEVTDPIKHKGYGLAYIIDKHELEINKLGFKTSCRLLFSLAISTLRSLIVRKRYSKARPSVSS